MNPVLDRFRVKYPQYKDVDDSTLASGIVKKYPQYSDALKDVLSPTVQASAPTEAPPQGYLGAVRDILAPMAKPENIQKLAQGVRQAKAGSPVTGGLNLANAVFQTAFTPISAIAGQMEKIPLIGKPAVAIAGAVPSALQAIGSGIAGSVADAYRYGGHIPGVGTFPPPFRNEKQAQEFKEALQETGGTVGMVAGAEIARPIGRGTESVASKIAGKAFGAGENFIRTKELGRVAQQSGITLSERGLGKATQFANRLNTEINSKIIDPATNAGVLLEGQRYISAMERFKSDLQNRAVPDRASILAVERMIASAQERLGRSQTPGFLTPKVAQELKVINNQILADIYKKLEAGGNITERGAAKKAALVEQTDVLRKQLEGIHPELKTANWNEGAFLELKDAIYKHLNRRARGEGAPGVVVRGGVGRAMTASIYDLLRIKEIESRLAVALGKVGRAMSGESPKVKYGVQNPFQASPWTPPPPQPPPTVGGTPIIPRPLPPTSGTGGGPVNANWSVVNPPPKLLGSPKSTIETMLPHRTTFEQDLEFVNQYPETARPMMEKKIPGGERMTNEELVTAWRSEPRTYLNEIHGAELDKLVSQGVISKESATKALGERGTENIRTIENLKTTEEVMAPTTPELLAQYRKYVSAEIAAGREPKPLSEWKREL